MTGVSRGLVGLVLFLSFVGPQVARAEPWRSSLHDLTYVVIEKLTTPMLSASGSSAGKPGGGGVQHVDPLLAGDAGGIVHAPRLVEHEELLVKVLDGCADNGHRWVFLSGGTNVGLIATVADTVTGEVHTYYNRDVTPFAPVQDTKAHACVP
jgi:hypothetical protein